MTDKQYTKEEQFLRKLAAVCKKYNVGISGDGDMGMVTIDKLDIVDIHISSEGEYAGFNPSQDIEGKV